LLLFLPENHRLNLAFLCVTSIAYPALTVHASSNMTATVAKQLAFSFDAPAAISATGMRVVGAIQLRKAIPASPSTAAPSSPPAAVPFLPGASPPLSPASPPNAASSRNHASPAKPPRLPSVATPRQLSRRRRHPRRKRQGFGRYEARRRAAPAPKPFCGHGAYRLVMVGIVAHVIGPEGRICEELTAWARHVLEPEPELPLLPGAVPAAPRHDPFAETRRLVAAMDQISMLLDAVNWVHPSRPEVLADLLEGKPGVPRAVILLWLRLRGCDVQNGRGRNGGKVLFPKAADDQWRVGVTISRFRQLFDFWFDTGVRKGPNPMQMDPGRSRMIGRETRKVKRSSKRWWLDVDGLFRTRHVERQAPRPHDLQVALKVLAEGRRTGWPEEVYLKYQGMYLIGARMGQIDAATAYGLLVAAKDDRHIALIQKGSRGALEWQALTPKAWRAAVLAMLGRRVKGGVATLMRWARSGREADHARLRRLYIFSPDGRAPTPAWKSAHLLRQVVERLGLSYRIRRDDGTIVTRWFTSHWFRHVFCNRMLDAIAASSADQATRDGARTKFANCMGWKHPEAMLAYYGRHHDQQEADLLVMGHQDDLDDEVMAEFGGEEWLPAANDNALAMRGRVVGGDLLD